jgi:hypothetical protein
MTVSPHLPVSVPYVEKLADLFVLMLFPIDPLTSLGTVQGGLAQSAVLEHDIWRCNGATDDAALGHDFCLSGVRLVKGSGCSEIPYRSVTYSPLFCVVSIL